MHTVKTTEEEKTKDLAKITRDLQQQDHHQWSRLDSNQGTPKQHLQKGSSAKKKHHRPI
jgi:hypothetical protein